MEKLKITEMNRLTHEEFKKADKIQLVVVLDNVRSLHNVGAMFRTADAFLLQGLYLCGITPTPPNAEIHKTALGAEYTVSWQYAADTLQAIAQLQAEGYTVLAVEQAKVSTMLHEVQLQKEGRYAIVFGHEVKGVQQAVVNACNGCVEIPQYGTKHSLNVSVTAGIVMYELSRQLR